MFVVQFENITCHWEFFVHRSSLRLVILISQLQMCVYCTHQIHVSSTESNELKDDTYDDIINVSNKEKKRQGEGYVQIF